MSLDQLPDGLAVERLAVTMAAAAGLAWKALSAAEARAIRIMANAALMHLGAEAYAKGLARLKERLGETVATMRRGADALGESAEVEPLVKALYRDAMTVELMLQILDGADEEEAI